MKNRRKIGLSLFVIVTLGFIFTGCADTNSTDNSTKSVTAFKKDYGDNWIYPTDSVTLHCENVPSGRSATVTVDGITYGLNGTGQTRIGKSVHDVRIKKGGDTLLDVALKICGEN